MLKISAFYLEKQKSFIPENDMAFAIQIFSEGFGMIALPALKALPHNFPLDSI